MITLATRLRDVLGQKTTTVLEDAFAIRTVADLMAHYPRRYEKRGELTSIAALADGDDVTILGRS